MKPFVVVFLAVVLLLSSCSAPHGVSTYDALVMTFGGVEKLEGEQKVSNDGAHWDFEFTPDREMSKQLGQQCAEYRAGLWAKQQGNPGFYLLGSEAELQEMVIDVPKQTLVGHYESKPYTSTVRLYNGEQMPVTKYEKVWVPQKEIPAHRKRVERWKITLKVSLSELGNGKWVKG